MKTHLKEKLRDLAFVNAFISIVDDRCAVIENVQNIVECNEIYVNIEASGFSIKVWGSGLTLSNYEYSIVEVNGNITGIELEKQRRISGK